MDPLGEVELFREVGLERFVSASTIVESAACSAERIAVSDNPLAATGVGVVAGYPCALRDAVQTCLNLASLPPFPLALCSPSCTAGWLHSPLPSLFAASPVALLVVLSLAVSAC